MWTRRDVFVPQGYPRWESCSLVGIWMSNSSTGWCDERDVAIDDVSIALVFCTGLAVNDGLVSIVKLCLWLLLVWFMCSMFCTYIDLRESGHRLVRYPHLVTVISFYLLSRCSFGLLGLLSLPLPLPHPQPFSSSIASRAYIIILFSTFESLSRALVSA